MQGLYFDSKVLHSAKSVRQGVVSLVGRAMIGFVLVVLMSMIAHAQGLWVKRFLPTPTGEAAL